MAAIPVRWASTEAGLYGASWVELQGILTNDTGLDVTATVGNGQDDVFAYSGGLFTNGGRSGFTMRLSAVQW